MTVVVHAELKEELQEYRESIEEQIESQYEAFRFAEEDPRLELMKKFKEKMGLDARCVLAALKKQQGIVCYFIVSSEGSLKQLRGHFESGVMKKWLKRIFMLLVSPDVVISHLKWDSEEYRQSMEQLISIKARG